MAQWKGREMGVSKWEGETKVFKRIRVHYVAVSWKRYKIGSCWRTPNRTLPVTC